MSYIIFQENYMGVGGEWFKVCQVANSLKEWLDDKYNLNGHLEAMKEHCTVFSCQDEQAETFRKYWKSFNELEDKLVDIVGLMPSKSEEELTSKELAEYFEIENQINSIYHKAWDQADELGLKMLDSDDIDEALKNDNPYQNIGNVPDGLYIVTHQVHYYESTTYGAEVYVDGIFPYDLAVKVASEIEDAEITPIEIGKKCSILAGCYFE